MVSCPACSESRWIYPRQHALGWVVTPLTGRQPCRCKACGWRGWRPPLDAENRPPVRIAAEYLTVVGTRLITLQQLAPSRAATWLIVSVGVGVAVAGVQFSAGKPAPTPDIVLPAEDHRPPDLLPIVNAVDRLHPHSRPDPVPASLPEPPLSPPEPPPAREPRTSRPSSAVAPAPAIAALHAAPQFRGSLVVTSEPSGATVKVDGQLVGPTPVVLADVRAGSRVVRIESTGYDPWSTAARVVANQQTRVNATLRREPQP